MTRKNILKIRLVTTLASFVFCVIVGALLLPGSTEGNCRINDISLQKEGSFTKVTIYADKPFEFVHRTVEKKDEKPHRLVIDCKDAIHNLPQHNFKKNLPVGTIKAIRTSQFQTMPESIVRIVLDLDKPVIYKVVDEGKDNKGVLAILTTQDSSFPFWAAVKGDEGASKTKSVKRVSGQTNDRMVLATVGASPEIFSVPYPHDRSVTSDKVEQEKVETDVRQKSSEDHSLPLSMMTKKEESSSAVQEEVLKMTTSVEPAEEVHAQEEERAQKEMSSTDDPSAEGEKGGIQENPPSPKQKAPSYSKEGKESPKEPAEVSKVDSSDVTMQEGEGVALLNPEDKSAQEVGELPDSLVVTPKPEGIALGVVPQRKIIYYHGEEKRDPFVPLTERMSAELGEVPLPTFESLRLVGILRDEAGNRALLEDERGYGYIMQNGDKIKNGYVVSVEDDKVTFQIEEYGWSKMMSLKLSS